MPYRKKIAEVEVAISDVMATITRLRRDSAPRARNARADLDKALASLARLKAERMRLMAHQRVHERSIERAASTTELHAPIRRTREFTRSE